MKQENYESMLSEMKKNGKEVIQFDIKCVFNGDNMAMMVDYKELEQVEMPLVDLASALVILKAVEHNILHQDRALERVEMPDEIKKYYSQLKNVYLDVQESLNVYADHLQYVIAESLKNQENEKNCTHDDDQSSNNTGDSL